MSQKLFSSENCDEATLLQNLFAQGSWQDLGAVDTAASVRGMPGCVAPWHSPYFQIVHIPLTEAAACRWPVAAGGARLLVPFCVLVNNCCWCDAHRPASPVTLHGEAVTQAPSDVVGCSHG
jgi:hypothetical protein